MFDLNSLRALIFGGGDQPVAPTGDVLEEPWRRALMQSDPAEDRQRAFASALANAGQALATTPGNFLSGLASAVPAGAQAYGAEMNAADDRNRKRSQAMLDYYLSERRMQRQDERDAISDQWKQREFAADQAYRNSMLDLQNRRLEASAADDRPKGDLITMRTADGRTVTVRKDDPQLDTLLADGATPEPKRATELTAPDKKAILEADEGILAGEAVLTGLDRALELNKQAYSGLGAGPRGYISSLVGSDAGVATEELKNVVIGQALDQLKAVFGGMPTEGERKILIDLQGSVDQAPEVRERIFKRAKAAAERRIEFNRKRAGDLRSGSYYDPPAESRTPQAGPSAPTAQPTTPSPEESPAAALPRPQSKDEYDAIPSGAQFIAPDGSVRRKP